jgi:hypothetical protein
MKLLVKDFSMAPPPISVTNKSHKPTPSHPVAQIKAYQEHHSRINKWLFTNQA